MTDTTPLAVHIPHEFLYMKNTEAVKDSVILKGVINKVLRKEIDNLESELGGCVLPDSVKREIKGHLKTREPTRINVLLDADLAERIKTLCKDTNMVRDALFTRIWFYMLGSYSDYASLSLPEFVNRDEPVTSELLSPIRQIASILKDPLWFVRDAMEEAWREHCSEAKFPGLYKIDLTNFEVIQNGLIYPTTDKLFVMTTCISEEQHNANKKAIVEGAERSRELAELLKDFDPDDLKIEDKDHES